LRVRIGKTEYEVKLPAIAVPALFTLYEKIGPNRDLKRLENDEDFKAAVEIIRKYCVDPPPTPEHEGILLIKIAGLVNRELLTAGEYGEGSGPAGVS